MNKITAVPTKLTKKVSFHKDTVFHNAESSREHKVLRLLKMFRTVARSETNSGQKK